MNQKKKIALSVALAFYCVLACGEVKAPEWFLAAKSIEAEFYADMANVTRDGTYATLWVAQLNNKKAAAARLKPLFKKAFAATHNWGAATLEAAGDWDSISRYRYDCVRDLLRPGDNVAEHPVPPGTVASQIESLACFEPPIHPSVKDDPWKDFPDCTGSGARDICR